MNTQFEDKKLFLNLQVYDPFPEPQTIPAGWDVSVLFPS